MNKAIARAGAHGCIIPGRGAMGEFLLKWKEEVTAVIVIEEPLEYPFENELSAAQICSSDERIVFLRRLVESGTRFRYAGIPGYPLEDPVSRELIVSGKRVIYVGYPTSQKAEVMGIDFRDLHDACWTALDVDYEALGKRCASLRDVIQAGSEVRITSAAGTDLTLLLKEREVYVDDGVISDWEVAQERGWGHLPAGKVIVAPVAGSANGVVCSDMTDYFGVKIAGIRLEFRDGEVVMAEAQQNNELLQLVLSEGKADASRLGGFEIGANPQIRSPIGYTVWDSKSFGDVTLWIGDNRLIGGENRADLSWGFMVVRPTVVLDGKNILQNREFLY